MKRIFIMVLKNILFVPWWFIQFIWYGREKDNHTEEERYALVKKAVVNANKGGRVTIKAEGTENIPSQNGFILFPNHQGMFDLLSIIESCDKPLSVVMKKEVENVILIKQVRKLMRAQPMDRSDIKQSMKVILQVAKEVSQGRNYVIFPEGTRSRQGNTMLEFKGGSFKAATKAKCPIVPVALINSFVPFDSHSIRPATVEVHYLPPIEYPEYMDMKTTEIAAEVKRRIQTKIEEREKIFLEEK